MKRLWFAILLCAAAALAQPAISPPALGIVRASSGSLHAVIGVAGNFILTDVGISNAASAAFSAAAGLVKTDTQLLLLDSTGQIARQYDAPSGPALFAFDLAGAPALAYYSGALYRLDNNDLKAANWTGDAISIALIGAGSAAAITRHDGQLWTTRIDLATGSIQNETLLDAGGPMLLLPGGGLLFTRDNHIVARDAGGLERLVPIAFDIASFEQMGKDWIAVRAAAGGALFALHITPLALELYQLPEVSQ